MKIGKKIWSPRHKVIRSEQVQSCLARSGNFSNSNNNIFEIEFEQNPVELVELKRLSCKICKMFVCMYIVSYVPIT